MAYTFDESDFRKHVSNQHDDDGDDGSAKISLSNFTFNDSYCVDEQEQSSTIDNDIPNVNGSTKKSEFCFWSTSLDKNSNCQRMKTFLRIRINTPVCKKYVIDGNCLQIQSEKNEKKAETYIFDQIFHEGCTQYDIFEKCALPLLKDFLLGQNSLLAAFGVTSSGKTYTMKGTVQQPGIIPYSLIMLFNSITDHVDLTKPPIYKPTGFCDRIRLSETDQEYENNIRQFIIERSLYKEQMEIECFESKEKGILEKHQELIEKLSRLFVSLSTKTQELSIWISYFEIYNDNIIDLLNVKSENETQPKLFLNQDREKNYYINGLRQVFVTSATEAYLVYLYGQQNLKRHISQTALNNHSSRSHSIFRITMVRILHQTQQSITSTINFCDLAGAERISKTGNTGQRAKETMKINQSLSALNHCISALNSKKRESMVISFRASKLTHVLQPYLFSNGGSFCIIFNLNPSPLLFEESIFSLSLCDSIKAVKPAITKSYIRRLTIRPDFNSKKPFTKDTSVNLVDIAEDEEMSEEDKNFLIEYYESILKQKEEEFWEYISDLKRQYQEAKINHEKEMKEKEAINNAKMDVNNMHFRTLLDENKQKIDQLENRLFENETELIELREKHKDYEKMQEQIDKFQKDSKEKDDIIENLQSQLNETKKKLDKNMKELELYSKKGNLQNYCSNCYNQQKLSSDLLNSLCKRKRKNSQTKQQEEDISVFSAKKRALLIERQQSTRKFKLKKGRSSEIFSPEALYEQFQSEQKLSENENRKPYNTRSRRKLF